MTLSVLPTDMVGGVRFGRTSLDETVEWLINEAVPGRVAMNVRLANAYNVALAHKSPAYLELLNDSKSVNLPDGTPVAWALSLRNNRPQAALVRGPSLFRETLSATTDGSVRHFFLGSTPDVLHALGNAIDEDYAGVRIAGMHSPPFAEVNSQFIESCAAYVSEASPDLLWVGLGTPKQDYVGTQIAQMLSIPVVNVGAAFDFVAGTVQEAPVWLRSSGFEWAYRLAKEPRRLWRRYLFGNARFMWATLTSWRAGDHR